MKIPSNIDECINQLTEIVSEEEKNRIINMDEDEFIFSSHFGLGLYIRNNWLYHPDSSDLVRNLFGKEFYHEDDVSSDILKVFYQALKNQR